MSCEIYYPWMRGGKKRDEGRAQFIIIKTIQFDARFKFHSIFYPTQEEPVVL